MKKHLTKEAAAARIDALEAQLAAMRERYDVLTDVAAKREAELGAENATLREHASASWSTWADALWNADDPRRPAPPADASTRESMRLLIDRYTEVMVEGLAESRREKVK